METYNWFVFYKDQILMVQQPDGYHIPTGEEPPVKVKDESFLFALIRASFNQRRKTLVNGLTNAAELALSKEEVQTALEEMGLSATVRGEALTLEQFAELSNLLAK